MIYHDIYDAIAYNRMQTRVPGGFFGTQNRADWMRPRRVSQEKSRKRKVDRRGGGAEESKEKGKHSSEIKEQNSDAAGQTTDHRPQTTDQTTDHRPQTTDHSSYTQPTPPANREVWR